MAKAYLEYPQFNVRVIPGRARINVIDLVVNQPDVKIYSIDMNTKRSEPWIAYGDGEFEITLDTSGPYVLRADENANNETQIIFNVPSDESWEIMVDSGRYTVTVALYKRSGDPDRDIAYVNMETDQEN